MREPAQPVEVPACAALHFGNGLIAAGRRHDEIIRATHEAGLSPKLAVQGFMTNRGRFVDRREAMLLALKADMPSAYSSDGKLHGKDLFSEDLY